MDLAGRLVSEAMGGAVERDKLYQFPWVLHFSELKFRLQSNVIPIGLIRRGTYCHRALLFKVSLGVLFPFCINPFNPPPTLYYITFLGCFCGG